jgi:hypothetical protein
MELEKNATLNIPSRTPSIQPSVLPFPSLMPAELNIAQHTAGDINMSLPQSRVRRRSNSPSPSIASLASISTLSSIHSAPPAPLNTGAGSHFQRPPLIRSARGRGSIGNFGVTEIQGMPTLNSPRSSESIGSSSTAPVTMFTYSIEPSTEELVATCHTFLQRLHRGSSQHVRERLDSVGPPPGDYGLFSFWIAQVRVLFSLSYAVAILTHIMYSSFPLMKMKRQSCCPSVHHDCVCGSSCTGSIDSMLHGASRHV